ncbi:MAG TPA: ATP-dependent DNA helicase [Gammaproteobacteria bacterium]|nr:ATP-dependent DNA helicase [Gammaproteobacteria bacterium]
MQGLSAMFDPNGALAQRLPGYTYRDAQRRMAEIVAAGIDAGEHVAIEAGTGIGKTFAYLIPALLSGRRVIVSTGTRTLQDQLFARDLPLLGRVFGRPADVALLKGRNNYLCWHRLETALAAGTRDAATVADLQALRVWGRSSGSGDLTEIEDLPEDHGLRGAVTSTVDNCLGGRCERFDDCFVLEARRRAQRADIVIVNHHLLLADLALKEAGFGELLPGADGVIVDEAHLFPDVAQQFFGVSITTRELEQLGRDVTAEARVAGLGGDFERAADALRRSVADLRIAEDGQPPGRVPWAAAGRRLGGALARWRGELEHLSELLAPVEDAAAGLKRCRERCDAAAARLGRIAEPGSDEGLRWLERSPRALAAHWTPLDVGDALAASIDAQRGAWIFTSATLAVGEDFSHFRRRVGIERITAHVLPSPFDYERNARLYIPQGLPEPNREDHIEALLGSVWPLVEAAGGGAFLLFTSYRALRAAQAWIEARGAPWPIFVQGEGPRSLLLERFREAGDGVLLGTGSFWQGVDVRGPALRLVALDKLPFASPGDPMVQARIEAIRREGGDPFGEAQLPQAVLALKQGVGRLIRDFEDRGLIVLGDPRLRTRSYGRIFLESLPPMPVLDERDDALAFASGLRPARADARRRQAHEDDGLGAALAASGVP